MDNNETIPLEPDLTVACCVPSYADEEPQIGSINPNVTDKVLIEWMSGTHVQ
jgi:hypothetical protein